MTLDPSIRAAVITAVTTVVTAVAGFAAVVFQIGRQSQHAIRQNRLNETLKLKVQIYERTLAISRTAQEAVSALAGYLRNFQLGIDLGVLASEGGRTWQPPQARFPEYQRLQSEATSAIIAVITMVEGWKIVDPKLDVFPRAIGMALDGHRKVMMKQPNVFVYGMPVSGFEAKWQLPDAEFISAIRDRVERENYYIELLSAWVGDFQTEMQILLLGDLFPSPVQRRDPPDPDQFCIRLDRYSEIMKMIDESEWGRDASRQEAEAWSRFAKHADHVGGSQTA
jgi:hypothetical protein